MSHITALVALAQESRLAIFRTLIQAGLAELPTGKIDEAIKIVPSLISLHMKYLLKPVWLVVFSVVFALFVVRTQAKYYKKYV